MIKRMFLMCLCVWLSIGQAHAQAASVSRIGAEVAAAIKYKASKRGFASNDPRYSAALAAVGTAVVEIGTAVVVAGTAPAWGAVLATTLLAGAVGYGMHALADWIFNADGTATYSPKSPPTWVPLPGQEWIWISKNGSLKGFPLDEKKGSMEACHSYWDSSLYVAFSSANYACVMKYNPELDSGDGPMTPQYMTNFGIIKTDADPNYMPPDSNQPSSPVTKPVAEALAGLSEEDKTKPLDASVIADIADAAWQKAASQPGYSGIPYSMSDPITAADVSAVRAENPSIPPATVGDLAKPISSNAPLGDVAAPVGNVGTGTNPAANQPLINLGPDPGIGSPSLEATPTGAQVVAPLAALMPDLRNFRVPPHSASCPRPSLTLFGKQIVVDGQCGLFEEVRGELYNAMLVTFLIIALFIILSA